MGKILRILKKAGEFCTVGASVATILVSVAAAFLALPIFVPFLIAAGVGLVCAIFGAYNEAKLVREEARREMETAAARERAYSEVKRELDEIKVELERSHRETNPGTAATDVPSVRWHLGEHFALFTPGEAKRTPVNDAQFRSPANQVMEEEKTGPRVTN